MSIRNLIFDNDLKIKCKTLEIDGSIIEPVKVEYITPTFISIVGADVNSFVFNGTLGNEVFVSESEKEVILKGSFTVDVNPNTSQVILTIASPRNINSSSNPIGVGAGFNTTFTTGRNVLILTSTKYLAPNNLVITYTTFDSAVLNNNGNCRFDFNISYKYSLI